MKVYEETKKEELDQEWVELISKAREMGLSTEEIRDFLKLKQ
ncbi:anti-repressor SinI family protein [Metabacillus endolithicus]|uniref:Anti-repressor SinI family protein n=1 Tax=Metabacillus endolithicus TaxID=1535204 RepID=A0ABW5BQV4_9BACI|nr:anti-repressor SinI family protein [Metabacillus endolithicus]UPG63571.1 anti-repressor SinI family protein [Metabacillus endolithicus]